MPYIKAEERVAYDVVLDQMPEIKTKGDLEYCVTRLMNKFMTTREKKYSTLHEVVYAVTHCADEFRRRFLDAREDVARETNGDVK